MKTSDDAAEFLDNIHSWSECGTPLRQASVPWLLLFGEPQPLILFITCCLLLVCRDPFSFSTTKTGTRDENQTQTWVYIKVAKSIPVYCPLSAITDVAPLSCCPETHLCPVGGGLVHARICPARAKENHCILWLLMKTSSFTSSPPDHHEPHLHLPFNHYIIKTAGCVVP